MTTWLEELDQLPHGLDGDDVRIAIAEHADLAAWPDDVRYAEAEMPAAFSTIVRNTWHEELAGAHIAHLYRYQLAGHGCRKLARAKRASAELAYLAGVDFVVTYNWLAWQDLTLTQRLALVDHVLSHCGHELEQGYLLVPHDVEEFGTIARRWGAWRPELQTFKRQLDLFLEARA